MSEFWSYDEAARTITDENGLTVARDVGAADGHAIIAAARGDAGLAYDAGYDDGNTDATNEAAAAAQALVELAEEARRQLARYAAQSGWGEQETRDLAHVTDRLCAVIEQGAAT